MEAGRSGRGDGGALPVGAGSGSLSFSGLGRAATASVRVVRALNLVPSGAPRNGGIWGRW